MNLHVGFTGTRDAITDAQRMAMHVTLRGLLVTDNAYFHHGDCHGADEQAHLFAHTFGYKIVIHPPENKAYRAYLATTIERMMDPKPYLERNKDIVDHCTILIAVPKGQREEIRSGTWSTVRYARKMGRTICIIEPDGTVTWENP